MNSFSLIPIRVNFIAGIELYKNEKNWKNIRKSVKKDQL